MPKAVAVAGDTEVKTSTKYHSSDTDKAGKWTLVSSEVTKGVRCHVGGKVVELRATATWSYVGGTANGSAVPPIPDIATLTAGKTLLTDQDNGILVDGDKAAGTGDGDNQIVVTASQQKLKTG